MTGRDKNKGVVSRIKSDICLSLEEGKPFNIIFNPLGLPNSMNLWRILEVHLCLICKKLGIKVLVLCLMGLVNYIRRMN